MLQIDRIALDRNRKPVMILVGKTKISQDHLDSNQKIIDYTDDNKHCKKCRMLMDPDEQSICKYCTGDF